MTDETVEVYTKEEVAAEQVAEVALAEGIRASRTEDENVTVVISEASPE